MADTKKTAVRNVSPGVRGLHLVTGYRDLNPNELLPSAEMTPAEFDSAKRTNYFLFGKAAEPDPKAQPTDGAAPPPAVTPTPAPPPANTDELDKMSDEDLKATTAALTGKPVESLPDDRDELLKLARGEA